MEHIASGKRVVYMSADLCMIYQHVHDAVIAGLQTRFGDIYNETNVLLSGTHTHSGPGKETQLCLACVTILLNLFFRWVRCSSIVRCDDSWIP